MLHCVRIFPNCNNNSPNKSRCINDVTNAKNNLELENADLISLHGDLATKNSSLMERISQMEIPYYRYLRLSALLPGFLKKLY